MKKNTKSDVSRNKEDQKKLPNEKTIDDNKIKNVEILIDEKKKLAKEERKRLLLEGKSKTNMVILVKII